MTKTACCPPYSTVTESPKQSLELPASLSDEAPAAFLTLGLSGNVVNWFLETFLKDTGLGPLHLLCPFLHPSVWNADVKAGLVAIISDQKASQSSDLEGAWVSKHFMEQSPGLLSVDFLTRQK